ncbi:hypothetical protein HZA44_04430 [Candidatus Peregrinibacteria bacterium]|nr:hypothetical protein [Candidatus Peregrinibacteria bacterium]
MTNAKSSHKHGMTQAKILRPKSKDAKRRNKTKASARKEERRHLKASLLGV